MIDLSPFKSSGPHGLHASFFLLLWPTVGNSVIDFAQQFFKTRRLPENMNEMLLVLIPKVDH